MKFKSVIGNPPYQGSNRNWQIYPFFYLDSRELSGSYSCLIFPSGWQKSVDANNLRYLNTQEIKEDKQIIKIYNNSDVFVTTGVGVTNILLWKNGYDNKLNGCQCVVINNKSKEYIKLPYEIEKFIQTKPCEILSLAKKVKSAKGFVSMTNSNMVSMWNPYGYRTFFFLKPSFYNVTTLYTEKRNSTDIKIYSGNNQIRYISKDVEIPKLSNGFDKYKVFVPYIWGSMNDDKYYGGEYSNIIVASPYEICTETYLENGCFDDYDTATKHAKYLMTEFVRAILFATKVGRTCSSKWWGGVPIQTYEEEWWNESIENIDDHLFKKYNIEKEISDVIKQKIQPRTEKNIVNYYENEESEI